MIILSTLPKFAIVGFGRAGKDEAAHYLAAHTPLVHPGSTSIYLLPYVVADRYQVPLEAVLAGQYPAACEKEYATRHEHRMHWYDMGRRLRKADPGVLVRSALEKGHMLVGARDL